MSKKFVDLTGSDDDDVDAPVPRARVKNHVRAELMQSDKALIAYLFSQTDNPQELVVENRMCSISRSEMLCLMLGRQILDSEEKDMAVEMVSASFFHEKKSLMFHHSTPKHVGGVIGAPKNTHANIFLSTTRCACL